MNGQDNCQVHVTLSNHLRLTARLDIPISDFYNNDGATTFMTNICAFLGIDTSRLKIVGIREGSVIVEADLQTDGEGTTQQDITQINEWDAALNTGISSNTLNVGYPILSASTQAYIFNTDGTVYVEEEEGDSGKIPVLLLVMAILIPALAITAGVVAYCYCKRKRAQIHEADSLNNKSSVNRENAVGSTEFEISAVNEIDSMRYGKKHLGA